MKRYILTLVTFLAVISALVGCGFSEKEYLSYRERFISAELSDGERSWRITPIPDGFTAEILSAEAQDVAFHVTKTAAYAALGEVKIPVSETVLSDIRRMLAFFETGETRVTETSVLDTDVCIRFSVDGGEELCAVFDADGSPVSFTAEGRTFTVTKIILQTD